MTSTPAELPQLPSLPAFGSLSLLDDGDDRLSNVWATTPTASTTTPTADFPASPSPFATLSSSNNQSSRPATLQSAAATPSPAFNISDLDPYAPAPSTPPRRASPTPKSTPPPRLTIGATVTPTSKLELIPNTDSDSPTDTPTDADSFAFISPPSPSPSTSSTPNPPPKPSPKPKPTLSVPGGAASSPSGSSGAGASGSGGFLGGMFRSFSGTNSRPGSPITQGGINGKDAEAEKASLAHAEFNEKGVGSTTPNEHQEASSTSSGIPNPIASLGSLFRSATSSPAPSNQPPVPSKGKEVEPIPSAEVVFDFNKFLEQMRQRSADPIAKYLRSFLKEFSRKPPVAISDQIRVINDFLDFIAGKMRATDPWARMLLEGEKGEGGYSERGEQEFDMAMEAMEKLVMNPVDLNSPSDRMPSTDDLERDRILSQRIRLFAWVKPSHLDLSIPPLPSSSPPSPRPSSSLSSSRASSPTSQSSIQGKPDSSQTKADKQTQGFIEFAKRELNKINQYKAPRDKLICVLNACKVIFGLIRHVSKDEGADAFVPFLIYVVLKANPDHLVSNLQYIQRFRNPEKLSGEGGYYLSSLNGAISFIETMDASSLSSITKEEFENEVELAIQALPIDPSDSTSRFNVPPPA
ncbi:Rab5 GDP/GTP exchange factor, partial [Phenoliferia sp. Uapishka_3]